MSPNSTAGSGEKKCETCGGVLPADWQGLDCDDCYYRQHAAHQLQVESIRLKIKDKPRQDAKAGGAWWL